MGYKDIGKRWGEGFKRKVLVESCVPVDLARFKPWYLLRDRDVVDGRWEITSETATGYSTCRTIDFHLTPTLLRLTGPLSRPDMAECQELRVACVEDTWGRRRWWLLCPACGSRVRIVYSLNGGIFVLGKGFPLACRRCHNLAYASNQQQDHKQARQLAKTWAWLGATFQVPNNSA